MFSLYPSGFIFEVLSSGQAEAAGMRVGDQILTVNGKPNSEYQDTPYALSFFGEIADGDEPKAPATGVQITFKRAGEKEPLTKFIPFGRYSTERIPTGRRLRNDVGYIEIPMMLGQSPDEMTRYAERVQQAIRDIDSKKPVRRWIVDLRRNQGGNSWPMLAGIGPLLGEGVIGPLDKRPGGNGDTTEYRDGQAISSGQVIAKVGQPYKLKAKNISVAVLTGPMTASSGEFVALWFRGLSNTRSFGEPSHGVPTANIGHRFSDGSGMNITIGLGLDRQGREYAGPVPVDTEAASSWPNIATEKDPAIAAAMKWLRTR
jgi:C-terminal processing protease CtpA/Prc